MTFSHPLFILRRSRRRRDDLLPALAGLERALSAKARRFHGIVKAGRTHLMDAVPVTLGQEFAGYAAQIRLGRARIADALPRVSQIPLGGTATGTGLNTHPQFAAKVRRRLAAETKLESQRPKTRSRPRPTATRSSSSQEH